MAFVTVYRTAPRPSARSRRALKPIKEGQVRCEHCKTGVRLRGDGLMRSHSPNGYQCFGSGSELFTDE